MATKKPCVESLWVDASDEDHVVTLCTRWCREMSRNQMLVRVR